MNAVTKFIVDVLGIFIGIELFDLVRSKVGR